VLETNKTRSYFVLLEELKQPGCPICSLFVKDSESYLDTLLYENVLDVPMRLNLIESFGLCNRHAWEVSQLPAICSPAVGFAIFASDLLRKFNLVVGAMTPELQRKSTWRSLLHKGAQKVLPQMKAKVCPACRHVAEFEAFHLRDLLDSVTEPEFLESYRASLGICLPHLFLAEQKYSNHRNFSLLLQLQLGKSQSLRQTLEEFIRKQDHRFRHEITKDEAKAWRVAVEFLVGKPGVFNNEARATPLSNSRADELSAKRTFDGALAFSRVSIGELVAKMKIRTAKQVMLCQKEPLPKPLLNALSDLVSADAHPAVEVVVEDVSDVAYLRKLHSAGFELFYGLGLPRETLIFLDSRQGFVLEDHPDIQRFKSLSSKDVEHLYYRLLWSRFGHAVSLCGCVKETDTVERLFCLVLEIDREVWCRLRGGGPDGIPSVGQEVSVFAWEKWFTQILDVIDLELTPSQETARG
jgi:hypothetical protein